MGYHNLTKRSLKEINMTSKTNFCNLIQFINNGNAKYKGILKSYAKAQRLDYIMEKRQPYNHKMYMTITRS